MSCSCALPCLLPSRCRDGPSVSTALFCLAYSIPNSWKSFHVPSDALQPQSVIFHRMCSTFRNKRLTARCRCGLSTAQHFSHAVFLYTHGFFALRFSPNISILCHLPVLIPISTCLPCAVHLRRCLSQLVSPLFLFLTNAKLPRF